MIEKDPDQIRIRRMLTEMRRQGVNLRRDGEFIRVEGVTPDSWLKEWISRHRSDLLKLINSLG